MSTARTADLDQIREWIRDGKLREVRASIDELAKKRLDRKTRLQLAKLANDAFLGIKAASLLHRRMDRGGRADELPTDEERAEYGVGLLRSGLIGAGTKILETINPAKVPKVYHSLTLGYFWMYEWLRARPLLEANLRRKDLSVEERLMTSMDLAVVRLHGDLDYAGAEPLLAKVAAEARDADVRKIQWQAIQLQAQARVYLSDIAGARELFDALDRIYDSAGPNAIVSLSTQMWRAIADLRANPASREPLRNLRRLKERFAPFRRGWFQRNCDYFEAYLLRDVERATRIIYGTPYPGLGRKLLRELGWDGSQIPASYDLQVGKPGKDAPWVEILNGANSLNDGRLKPGQLPQRMLRALAADFYQPPDVPRLYELAYPEERLDPDVFAARVRQGLLRLRQWLAENDLPLAIREHKGTYLLESEPGLLLRIRHPAAAPATLPARGQAASGDPRLADLVLRARERYGESYFRAKQVEELLGCGRSTAVALLREASAKGVLLREGGGRSSRYRLK